MPYFDKICEYFAQYPDQTVEHYLNNSQWITGWRYLVVLREAWRRAISSLFDISFAYRKLKIWNRHRTPHIIGDLKENKNSWMSDGDKKTHANSAHHVKDLSMRGEISQFNSSTWARLKEFEFKKHCADGSTWGRPIDAKCWKYFK